MLFKFKQFEVDQSHCAMKINTDGVLLGAFVEADTPQTILDIGTGTGVIALMLAQKFNDAQIDAVELDIAAARTAGRNFANAPFNNKPNIYQGSFQQYFAAHSDKKYDLIVSNPPFYINSLEASAHQMNLAKHADGNFFEALINAIAKHLNPNGECWLILPLPTATLVRQLAGERGLHLHKVISIKSFADSQPHREMLVLTPLQTTIITEDFVIYADIKVYSKVYQDKLREFFTIF